MGAEDVVLRKRLGAADGVLQHRDVDLGRKIEKWARISEHGLFRRTVLQYVVVTAITSPLTDPAGVSNLLNRVHIPAAPRMVCLSLSLARSLSLALSVSL